MRIVGIETYKFWARWCNWLFVSVSTDEGLTGWGEGSLHGAIGSVEAAIGEMAPALAGREFAGPGAHWQDLYHGWRWRGGAIQNTAMSALDLALWDLEGKRLGVPVSRLLGGAVRPRVTSYASHWLGSANTPDEAHAGAKEAVARGYRGFKWSIGKFWEPTDELSSIGKVRDFMAAARDGAGPNVEIYVECAERLSPRAAIRLGEALAPYQPGWFEEPVPFENPKAMAQLQREIAVPVATGERLLSRWEFQELFAAGGVGVVQPDVMHAGGLTEVRKIADLAEVHYIPVAPHNPAGPIATLASIHLGAAIPNFAVLENMEEERALRERVCPSMPALTDGGFDVPQTPGLGADIDLAAIAEFTHRPQPRGDNRPWWR